MKLRIPLLLLVLSGGMSLFAQTKTPARRDTGSPIKVIQADSIIGPQKLKTAPGVTAKEDADDSDFQIKHPAFRLKLTGPAAAVPGKPVHSSRRAWMLSTALPGTGQIYNHRYWKLPIIYGGFIGLIISVDFNQRYYNTTLQYYKILLINPASTTVPSEYRLAPITQVASVKDFYRRNRDLSVIGAAVLWLANSVDAYVDSELKGFDVSNVLTMRVDPYISPFGAGNGGNPLLSGANQPVYGLKLVMSFK